VLGDHLAKRYGHVDGSDLGFGVVDYDFQNIFHVAFNRVNLCFLYECECKDSLRIVFPLPKVCMAR